MENNEIAPDDPVAKELEQIMNFDEPPPESLQEYKERAGKIRPKLTEFYEKHKDEPIASSALSAMVLTAHMSEDFDIAMDHADLFLKRYPDDKDSPHVKWTRAELFAERGNIDEACRILREILKEYPDFKHRVSIETFAARLDSIGTEAKDFKTKTLDGKLVSLRDFRGKVILLDFSASWCGPCMEELPCLKKAYEKFHRHGFEIFCVSLDQTAEDARSLQKEGKISWIVTWEEPGGWENPVAKSYGVHSVPTTYLIDAQGKVIATDLRGAALETALAKLFADKESATTEPAAK